MVDPIAGKSCDATVLHPWHGIEPRVSGSDHLCAYIEIVPGADLKFELDKPSGWLRVDRPHKYASRLPAMYGLLPKTYCAEQVAKRCMDMTGMTGIKGDGDPMDVIVLSEHVPAHGGFLVNARAVGGLRMIDSLEADDKIIAVMEGDPIFGHCRHIGDVPKAVIARLLHYFTTYKQPPDDTVPKVIVPQVYDRDEAVLLITLSMSDYIEHFPT